MKKLFTSTLLFILMTTLCVGLIGCDFVNDILGNAKTNPTDGTTDGTLPSTDNTTPSNTEPTDTNPTDTDPGDLIPDEIVKPNIQYQDVSFYSKEAYTEFLNSAELPDNFVSHDKIDDIGDFDALVFLSEAYHLRDYSWYMYTLVDSEGFEITLYVDHRDRVLSTKTPVSNVNKTDMRLLPDASENVCVYVSNNMEYTYISGKLHSISWETQNITYILCASGTPMLSDYPLTDSTFVGKMLNTETAPQALNDVFNTPTQDPPLDVPYSVSFSSIAEMKDFLNSAKGSAAQYEEFIQQNNINASITQSHAQHMATNVEQNDIPLVTSNSVADDFGATYYLDRNELDIIYKINGIRYRFVYKYNKTSSFAPTTPPVLENVNLGTYVFDLYQGDGCFVGELVTDFAVVQVVVYAEQTNDVALNVFNMEVLQNHDKK